MDTAKPTGHIHRAVALRSKAAALSPFYNPRTGGLLMTYLLYMKRSFIRSPRRHAVLFAVLTCAFLLPLLISIYRDSSAWGTRQYLLTHSAGETYHIGNASEWDVPYFAGIRGLSAPVFRDGTIYLRILSEEEWRDWESVAVFDNEIRKRMEASGNTALRSTAFSYEYAHGISTDPSHLSQQRVLLLVNMLVILLSVSVVRSAYQSHLKQFSSDVGTLLACGASRRQVSALFAAELAAVFLVAAACAVGISVVSLKALFTAFLEIRHRSLAWLIFHVEPMNILLHLGVFFVTLGLSLGMALHRYRREPVGALLNGKENAQKSGRRRKPLRRRSTPAATLCGLWRSRTNRSFRSCLAVSLPVMAVFLLLFHILTLALQVTGAEEEWGLRVSHSVYDGEGFSAEDMAYVSSLEGVERIRPLYEPRGYILLPESPDETEKPLQIRPYSSLDTAAQTLSKYEIAVGRKSGCRLGDVLRLCRSEAYYDINGCIRQPAPEEVTVLTVAALADTKPSGWALDIYVSDELYADIIASVPATGIEIALLDPAMNGQVEAALQARFAGAEYAITNRQSGADFLREMSSGVYLLLGYIFAALFLLILLILYVRLWGYIWDSRPVIRSLHRLGASKRTLYRSYTRQAGISAAIAVTVPFLIALPLTALLCLWQKVPLHIDGGMVAVYAALAALLLFAYWYPIHRSLKGILRRL